jgi:hypothetical protein
MNTYDVTPDVHQAARYLLVNPSIYAAPDGADSFGGLDMSTNSSVYTTLPPILTSEGWLGSNYVKSATYRVPMPTNSSNTRFRGRVKMKSGNFYYFDVMIPQ